MRYVTQFFHKGDWRYSQEDYKEKSSVIEASGADYAKTPNEVMSERGSLDLVKTKKVIGNLGESRFCWVMGKETEFETQPQAWVGSEEMKVMKDEER